MDRVVLFEHLSGKDRKRDVLPEVRRMRLIFFYREGAKTPSFICELGVFAPSR